MQAVHIHAEDVHDENDSAFVEMVVRLTRGVKDVASIRSLHLISVLYDEQVSSLTAILGAIRRAGFRAHAVKPDRLMRARSNRPAGSTLS